MLIRISLIVAIIAGLAVGALNIVKIKQIITTLVSERETEKGLKEEAQRNLAKTEADLKKTQGVLAETQVTLTNTIKLKDQAIAEASTQKKHADQLNDELARTKTDLADKSSKLASYEASGLTPDQALTAAKELKRLNDMLAGSQDENLLLGKKIKKLETELAVYRDPQRPVELPSSLLGKVMVFDPKWNFVVLNVGEDQGALQRGEMLVSRHGHLVGKIRITSVQKDRSIANLEPGWSNEIQEGDDVIPANPAS
jgi:hypothetical protein